MNKKRINYKLLLIIIDIVAIIGLVLLYFQWINNNNIKNDETEVKEVTFKKFTYTLPIDIEYTVIDYDTFMLKNNQYEAIVKIFVADDVALSDYLDDYYNYLLDHGVNVTYYNSIDINNTSVYTYDKYDDRNSVLCYFETFSPFIYELELYNSDNTFNVDSLKPILEILSNASYDYDTYKPFEYYESHEIFNYADIEENENIDIISEE